MPLHVITGKLFVGVLNEHTQHGIHLFVSVSVLFSHFMCHDII